MTRCRSSSAATFRRRTAKSRTTSGWPRGPRIRGRGWPSDSWQACESARTVVAYNAAFERRCLEQMAEALPALATPLRSIAARLVDLLPVVRQHVYHPEFGGSFSLKSVVPGARARRPV